MSEEGRGTIGTEVPLSLRVSPCSSAGPKGRSFISSHLPPVSATNPTRNKRQFHSSKLLTLCTQRRSRGKDGPLWEGTFFCLFSSFLLSGPVSTFCTYTPCTGHKGRGDVFASTSIYYLFYLLKYHFCLGKILGMVGVFMLLCLPLTKPFPINLWSGSLTSENTLIVSNSDSDILMS